MSAEMSFEQVQTAVSVFAAGLGMDANRVSEELRSDSALAQLVRKMFDVAKPKRRGGRPSKAQWHWEIARRVQIARVVGGATVDDAVADVCAQLEGEGRPLEHTSVKRYYDAARAEWPEVKDVHLSISDMFFVRDLSSTSD